MLSQKYLYMLILTVYLFRYNLDPDGSKSDDELWNVLDIAQLKPIIEQLPEKLGEGLENCSGISNSAKS